jgi:hypothetical protein
MLFSDLAFIVALGLKLQDAFKEAAISRRSRKAAL